MQPAAPAKPTEDPQTLFEAVAAFVATNELPGASWSARCVLDNAPDCFLRGSPAPRRFVILEVQVSKTYTYAIDALRHPDDVEFPLTMARRVGAAPLEPAHFHVWLRGFGAQSFCDSAQNPRVGCLAAVGHRGAHHGARNPSRSVFRALNGGNRNGLPFGKHSEEGIALRKGLLSRVLGHDHVAQLVQSVARWQAATDDVLDALVALWSAERVVAREAVSLPASPDSDATGLVTAIWH